MPNLLIQRPRWDCLKMAIFGSRMGICSQHFFSRHFFIIYLGTSYLGNHKPSTHKVLHAPSSRYYVETFFFDFLYFHFLASFEIFKEHLVWKHLEHLEGKHCNWSLLRPVYDLAFFLRNSILNCSTQLPFAKY